MKRKKLFTMNSWWKWRSKKLTEGFTPDLDIFTCSSIVGNSTLAYTALLQITWWRALILSYVILLKRSPPKILQYLRIRRCARRGSRNKRQSQCEVVLIIESFIDILLITRSINWLYWPLTTVLNSLFSHKQFYSVNIHAIFHEDFASKINIVHRERVF